MSEKILFTDLDGTLLNSAKKVSPGMQLLLSKMVLAGNRLVLTSGRALPSVLKVAKNAGSALSRYGYHRCERKRGL